MKATLAYIDAGTGSLVMQLVAGGIAGLAAFVKFRWSELRGRFSKDRAVSETEVSEE